MSIVDELYGLVPAPEAEAAVEDLERHGIYASEIEVHEPEPGRYRLTDELLHREARGAEQFGVAGAVIGVVVGLVAAIVVPAIDDAGLGGWLVAAFGGAGFGALVGAMAGLQMNESNDDDPVRWREVTPDGDERLVAVYCEHFHNKAHRILEQHGATFVSAPTPGDRSTVDA